MTDFIVLGAGPAGLGAALGLARKGHGVTVLERGDRVGGNAGSFELAGVRVDYGSHRFHPAADPSVFNLVRELLGDDLLERPRHGRIRLLGRWIHFPLRGLDLALHGSPRFAAGVLADLGRKALASEANPEGAETFASVLERGLGRTICQEFYFPYARKIWGLQPHEISPIQARRRVSSGSIRTLVKRLLPGGAGSGARNGKGIFYYPRRGYGQICERLAEAAEALGARVLFGTAAKRVVLGTGARQTVTAESPTGAFELASHHVWSTIPVTTLVRLLEPGPPEEVLASASMLRLRSMLLVYLVLGTNQFTEFDAHYFPEEGLPFTRVSEPKNYAGGTDPEGVTILCAEIPCDPSDPIWSSPDVELGPLVLKGLEQAGLPVRCRVLSVEVKRLPAAYPIYRLGYEEHFDRVDRWVDGLDGVLSFGRQGLYAHDNTHHALFMAHGAVESLRDGELDRRAWHDYRRLFDKHVVED